jgi:GH24 family phage-related lysozyme (muramidase)
MADANAIQCPGVPYPMAIEIARQMTAGAGNGNADRLMAIGVGTMQANELAAQINAGAFAAHKLALAMWPPDVAKNLKAASGL